MKIAREGFPPVVLLTVVAALAWLVGWNLAALVSVLLASVVIVFFRDPERQIPGEPDLVVSPADGRVVEVVPEAGEGGDRRLRVSIFLSLFDVHVNRSPIAAQVTAVQYRPGVFLPAFHRGASRRNEQNRIELDDGSRRISVVQIAGWVARRIVCRTSAGDRVERGQRLGLIRFGSRVDLYLPETIELRVQVGDRVRGGGSVIGRLVE